MEERTFISSVDVHSLLMSLENYTCYNDARSLLNAFIRDNTGKEYEVEDGTIYYNSKSPNDIKQEALIVIDESITAFNDFDDASDRGLICGRKVLESQGIICDDGTIVSEFRKMRRKKNKVAEYIDIWRNEPAIKIENRMPRLRPRKGAENYICQMYPHLQMIDFIDKGNIYRNSWLYVCGLSDEMPDKLIPWKGGNYALGILVKNFFCSHEYFEFGDNEAIQQFVISFFANPKGERITPNSVWAEKSRTEKRQNERGKLREYQDKIWNKIKVVGNI